MKNNKKKNWKKIIGSVVGAIIVLFIAVVIILQISINPRDRQNEQTRVIAEKKTPIKSVTRYYHLNRDQKSFALEGKSKKQKDYYLIYLPTSKKAYLYDTKQGKSRAWVINTFSKKYPNRTIKSINLGWYSKRAVWEIRYNKMNDKSGFIIYQFKNGEEISYIDNL